MLSTKRAGRKIESATIKGTGHHRVQCPMVLSQQPQALQVTSEIGLICEDCCQSLICSAAFSLVYAWNKGRLHGAMDHTVSPFTRMQFSHIGGDWWPKGKAELRSPQCTHFCWCLVPLMLSHTSSSWLTAHLKSVYLAIPSHCLLGAPATKSTHIWSIPPFQPSLSILMASLLLASRTMPEITTFLRLAIIWAGVPAFVVSALKISSKRTYGCHIFTRSWTTARCLLLEHLPLLPTWWRSSNGLPSRK